MPEKLLVLLLGSNLGNRIRNLEQACMLIGDSVGAIQSVSSMYKTAPWGFDSKNTFYNQCISVKTNLDPGRILEHIHLIEAKLGRKSRSREYADRTIDIDILLYGDMVLSLTDLQIPHRELPDRRFALVPLAEILPDFEHPVSGEKITVLLSDCKDTLPVRRIGTD